MWRDVWLVFLASGGLALLLHIARKLDEIADILRKRSD